SLGRVRAEGAGTATITATADGQSGQAAVVVSPAANRLVYKTEPSDVVAGAVLNPAIRVEIQDANGNVVTKSKSEVTLTLVGGAEGAVLLGKRTAMADGGVATFEGLKLERAGSGYRLKASAAELAAVESEAFAVQPAAAARLAFSVVPVKGEGQVALAPAVEVGL